MEAGGVPDIGAEEFAALIAQASDGQIAQGMAANRRLILDEIFRQMPTRLRRDAVRDVDAVIEWRIKGDGDAVDRYHVTIRNQECVTERDGTAEPDVTYTIGQVDFIRLISGQAQGPALFVFGKLKIRGDLLLAARVPGFFAIPRGS